MRALKWVLFWWIPVIGFIIYSIGLVGYIVGTKSDILK